MTDDYWKNDLGLEKEYIILTLKRRLPSWWWWCWQSKTNNKWHTYWTKRYYDMTVNAIVIDDEND